MRAAISTIPRRLQKGESGRNWWSNRVSEYHLRVNSLQLTRWMFVFSVMQNPDSRSYEEHRSHFTFFSFRLYIHGIFIPDSDTRCLRHYPCRTTSSLRILCHYRLSPFQATRTDHANNAIPHQQPSQVSVTDKHGASSALPPLITSMPRSMLSPNRLHDLYKQKTQPIRIALRSRPFIAQARNP